MKKKYICPMVTISNCDIEAQLLAGTTILQNSQSELSGEGKKSMEKTDEEVDLCAKGFNAWDTWD